jgi:hypothetical protein
VCDDAGRAAGDRQELHGTGGKDYGAAIERYHVSYPQVYSWVRKYDEQGIAGLNDRRGKRKPLEEMTEVEALCGFYYLGSFEDYSALRPPLDATSTSTTTNADRENWGALRP